MFFSIPVVFVVLGLLGWAFWLKAKNKRLEAKNEKLDKLLNDINL